MRIPTLRTGRLLSLALLATLNTTFTSSAPAQALKSGSAPHAQAAAAPTSLTWSNDLRTTMTQAKAQRRWILVDCYTDWCHWCKKLDADVFQNPTVAKHLGNSFCWVKCNTENPSTGVWVKEKYGVAGYPCCLILDPAGNEKGRVMGYLPPDLFIQRVAGIVSH